MKRLERMMITIALALMGIAAGSAAVPAAAQQTPVGPRTVAPTRLLSPIDEGNTVTLSGNVRKDLTPDRDLGPVEDSMELHLYMVLRRTPEQQADLDYLIARQQERTAPEYHQWLTPKQFGARFGAHPDDIATLSNWLQSHGMNVRNVLDNASIIDFAATAGQVRDTFHTEMHYFNSAGGRYAANVADPEIPAALAPLVAGIEGMVKTPAHTNQTSMAQAAYDEDTHTWHKVGPSPTGPAPNVQDRTGRVNPDYYPASGGNGRGVAPQDLYTIYDINPIFNDGDLAQTATIAVVEQSDMAYGTVDSKTGAASGGDIVTWRSVFGVPGKLNLHVYHGYGKVSCGDPGVVTGDEEKATIETEWTNATAPSVNLVFMSCDDSPDQGALTSLLAVIDNNLADVVTLGYTVSELSATAPVYTFLDTVEAQAATQGQSILVSAGSGGSDEQDAGTTGIATSGANVSAYSSPLVTVVGATDFQDIYDLTIAGPTHPLSDYWKTTNSQYYADALSYVPETAWNGSCASTINALFESRDLPITDSPPEIWCALDGSDSGTVLGGGGGTSTHYAVPAWQTGISGYSGAYRSSPDISSFGSDGLIYGRALLYCDSNSSTAACTSTSTFGVGGGTGFPVSYLAGVAGLLVTYTGSRQGLLNPALYALAKAQYTNSPTSCYANGQAQNDEVTTGLPAASCIFNDVTTSGNDVPCTPNSPDCQTVKSGEPAGLFVLSGIPETGYDGNAYTSAPGYDQATGIGSVNVNNLIANWYTAFTSATTLTASSTSITASETTTLKATVTGGGTGDVGMPPVPTGTVSFKAGTKPLGSCTLDGGSCTLPVNGTSLASGANSVTATFAASPQYPSSTSNVLTITVAASVAATPTFSPSGGTFTTAQTVKITDATAGSTIYYTVNGATPTASSTPYTAAITVAATETLKAIAFAPGYGQSAVASAAYTIQSGSGVPATLTSPAAGTTLGTSATFTWNAGSGVTAYQLWLGTTANANNIYNSHGTLSLSETVTGIPASGGTIFVTLYSQINGVYKSNAYTFTASGTPAKGVLTTPVPGAKLTGASATFAWTAGTGVTAYQLWLGSKPGINDIFNSGGTANLSVTVSNLPTNGGTIFATLFSLIDGAYQNNMYTYVGSGTPALAVMTGPTPGSTLSARVPRSHGRRGRECRTISFGWERRLARATCITRAGPTVSR